MNLGRRCVERTVEEPRRAEAERPDRLKRGRRPEIVNGVAVNPYRVVGGDIFDKAIFSQGPTRADLTAERIDVKVSAVVQ